MRINERLSYIKYINANISMMNVYATSEKATEEEKDVFYEEFRNNM